MVGAAWPSTLLAVVFSQFKKELAKNVCRPDTQNVACHKEFIRAMERHRGELGKARKNKKINAGGPREKQQKTPKTMKNQCRGA